jgi:hypothetical protein
MQLINMDIPVMPPGKNVHIIHIDEKNCMIVAGNAIRYESHTMVARTVRTIDRIYTTVSIHFLLEQSVEMYALGFLMNRNENTMQRDPMQNRRQNLLGDMMTIGKKNSESRKKKNPISTVTANIV